MFKKVMEWLSGTLGIVTLAIAEILDTLELLRLQKIFYLFSILFLLVGFSVYIRNQIAIRKHKKKVKNVLPKSSAEQIIENVSNPVAKAEEIGHLMLKIKKGERIMFQKIKSACKWLWGNKFTLITLISNFVIVAGVNFVVFTDYIYQFQTLADNKVVIQYAVPALSVVWSAIDIYTTFSKRGCETLEELNEVAKEKAEKKASKLTKEQKASLKKQMAKIKEILAPKEARFKEIVKRIEEIDFLIEVKCATNAEMSEKAVLSTENATLTPIIASLKAQIVDIENKLTSGK